MRWRFWRREDTEEPEGPPGDEEPEEEKPKSLRESAILFARDIAVAFLVVAIVLGAMFAYTQVWPPMVVVESDSMQHSDAESFIGVIDTGDLVLVQSVRTPGDVTTYIEGRARNHATYSDFGDVIIFQRPGAGPGSTPIIHRAMAYVQPNATSGADVPSLADLDPQFWRAERDGVQTPVPFGITAFTLLQVGYRAAAVRFDVSSVSTAGFLTKGDHNDNPDTWGPVGVGRILGKARGELPWFGLIKLTLAPGATGCCPSGWGDRRAPSNSWDALLISLILIIVGPFAADFGWSWWKERRKERRKAAEAASEKPAEAAVPNPDGEEPPPLTETPPPEAPPEPAPLETPPEEPTDESQTGSVGPAADSPERP